MPFSSFAERKDISCVLCGAAGLGIQTVEDMLAKVVAEIGLCVFGTREYMSRVRGGNNSTELRIASSRVDAFLDRIDILIPLSRGLRPNITGRISSSTVIIADPAELGDELERLGGQIIRADLSSLAKDAGGKVYSNSVAAGLLLGILGLGTENAEAFLAKRFSGKKDEVAQRNQDALRKGYVLGQSLAGGEGAAAGWPRAPRGEKIILNGSDAVSLGAMAAGCNFVTAYPMSPATGVLSFFAKNALNAGAVVEQAEDELAAINMAVGAAYAGGRPIVTTSGGGFALMGEGISLAGVVEAPVVVHLSQRPGPATGMATRTEQADLELALYSGHGEFPRAIFAPGTMEGAFEIAQRAFRTAEKFQTPVIILTDQYFMNSFHNVATRELSWLPGPVAVPETGDGYRRYEKGVGGRSPFGIPGWGKGIVGADSHEHDEAGHVYEDFDLRKRMQEKRMGKLVEMTAEALPPRFFGPEAYENLVIGWGSTLPILREALSLLERNDTALLCFEQVWPLHDSTKGFLEKASKTLAVVEGNSTGQFARLLRAATGIEAGAQVLKYNGLQFSVEEAASRLREALSGKGGIR